MTAEAEYLLQQLELALPRYFACARATWAFPRAKTYDVEVWLPSYNAYKEISSCSNCERLPGAPRKHQVSRPRELQGYAPTFTR